MGKVPALLSRRTIVAFGFGALLVGGIAAGSNVLAEEPTGGGHQRLCRPGHRATSASSVRAGRCLPAETPLSWNQTGVSGPAGPIGPVGPTGADGPAGTRGRCRTAGRARPGRTVGPQGDTAHPGEAGAAGERADGPAGPQGEIGPQGPAGPSGGIGGQFCSPERAVLRDGRPTAGSS